MKRNTAARDLFAGIASNYDRWANVLSLFQYRRWHAALLASVNPLPGQHILDVSTGTGAVALDLAAKGCDVVGLDLSREMLGEAVRRTVLTRPRDTFPQANLRFVEGRAEELPFPDAIFDAVTFSFLLRYVADPMRPIKEIARVLRRGGRVGMLEFAIPEDAITSGLWSLYTMSVLPTITPTISPGWAAVGAFLGGSILDFYRQYPLTSLVSEWREAGLGSIRCRRLSLGGAIIVSGEKC